MKNILIVVALFVSLFSLAQNQEQEDLKVGLVLSGGGAKGFAHIGVLKVIDSLGIRVDYIAGTSMGAIIGSMYASGYSGKEIDSIIKSVDFDDLIGDNLPRKAKTFYERDNSEKYAVSLPFKNFKVKLPRGLSRGQNILSLLTKLTLHVSDIDDFSKLPIPFFCVATDVETGEAVYLEKGNLSQTVLASGAFPSLFQPVRIGDKVLIDGGVVNNYPLDELKAKGVDLIIGVDVQDDLKTRDDLQSATKILLQINNYRTINDLKTKSVKTDIYIKPDITDFNVVSFDEGRIIIDNGTAATNQHIDALKEIAAKQKMKKKQLPRIQAVDSLQITGVVINDLEKYTRAYVLGKLKLKPGEKISYNTFQEGVNNLAATNNFENISFSLTPSITEQGYLLHINLRESKLNTLLKLGIHYDDLYKSGVLLNVTQKKILFNNDVASLDFIVGDNIRYNFDYYIDKGFYWSVGVHSRYNQFQQNVSAETILTPDQLLTINVNQVDVKLNDFTNQLYLQTLFRKDFSLTLGAEHKHLKIKTETILTDANQEETAFDNSSYLSLFGKLKLDTFDNKYFPNDGVYFDSDFHLYLYSSDFNNDFTEFSIGKATIGYAKSFSEKFTVNLSTEGGFKIGENKNRTLDFVIGGYGNTFINNFKSFYGYDFLSLVGNSYVKGVIDLDYEFYKKNHVNFAANYANIGDGLFDSGEWFSSPDYSGYAVGYGLDTFFGPVEAKYSWSPETKEGMWFFNVGFWF
ncbi:patatin-like phospholipase family protein [Lacinutrix sp. C3R15]|uniref:patatin-like phospholipase family protein n=1 Tax=Flavobacteriaceae TaxID=49546 RepID=UPI001C08511D|nr:MULTISPECIES: patatin-like phospholipase family protein [Flavobacteriaceae]MBU2940895.1 patatin-like phospholipase family protein [Lacinutrix sp. C3R15]MDO6624214.1 patatin-like phospholipase family protein [Oceanihabitans sp. 1_MG-2023]